MKLAVCIHAATHGKESHGIHLSPTTAKTAIQLATYYSKTATRHQAMVVFDRDQELIRGVAQRFPIVLKL